MSLNKIIIQPAYFAPIAQYAVFLQAKEALFETQDHFTKQTFRNRCNIFAANGVLSLNIPIKKNKDKTPTPLAEISYAEDWQSLHIKSLQSAYKNAPFYEFYETEIKEILSTPFKNLGELHLACHRFVIDALQENTPHRETTTYQMYDDDIQDLRSWIEVKKQPKINVPTYIQMFDDKHGFQSNLSILDLLFMEGPAAVLYLEKLACLIS